MSILITTVGILVLFYSDNYMSHDQGYLRFFAYMSFFNTSMKGMIATIFCLIGLLVLHWIYSGHFPLSDLHESLIFLSWSFSIILFFLLPSEE